MAAALYQRAESTGTAPNHKTQLTQAFKALLTESLDTAGDLIDDATQEYLAFDELRKQLETLIGTLPEKSRLVYRLSKEEGNLIKRSPTNCISPRDPSTSTWSERRKHCVPDSVISWASWSMSPMYKLRLC